MKTFVTGLVALSAIALAMPAAAQDSARTGGGSRQCESAPDPAACQAARRDGQSGQGGRSNQGGQSGQGQSGQGQSGQGQSGQGPSRQGGQSSGGQDSQGSGGRSSDGQGSGNQGSGAQGSGAQGSGGQTGGRGDAGGSNQGAGRDDSRDYGQGADRNGAYGRGDDRGYGRDDNRGWNGGYDRGIAVGEPYGDGLVQGYDRIERMIDRGMRSGRLNRREAMILTAQLRDLRRLDRQYRFTEGRLNRFERADLQARTDRLEARLRFNGREDDRRDGGYRR